MSAADDDPVAKVAAATAATADATEGTATAAATHQDDPASTTSQQARPASAMSTKKRVDVLYNVMGAIEVGCLDRGWARRARFAGRQLWAFEIFEMPIETRDGSSKRTRYPSAPLNAHTHARRALL